MSRKPMPDAPTETPAPAAPAKLPSGGGAYVLVDGTLRADPDEVATRAPDAPKTAGENAPETTA